jgi:hypothetical protein
MAILSVEGGYATLDEAHFAAVPGIMKINKEMPHMAAFVAQRPGTGSRAPSRKWVRPCPALANEDMFGVDKR